MAILAKPAQYLEPASPEELVSEDTVPVKGPGYGEAATTSLKNTEEIDAQRHKKDNNKEEVRKLRKEINERHNIATQLADIHEGRIRLEKKYKGQFGQIKMMRVKEAWAFLNKAIEISEI